MADEDRGQAEVAANVCGCGPAMSAMMMACYGRSGWSEGAGVEPKDESPPERAGD